MKGLLKRIGALVLILAMFTQCFGTHVYAAPDEDNLSIEEINSSESGLTESEEEITQWIMDNLMNESLSVSERPQEWWDTLTEEQRLAADELMIMAMNVSDYSPFNTLDTVENTGGITHITPSVCTNLNIL